MPVGAIGSPAASWGGSYVLGMGSRGPEVSDLQQRLTDAGFDCGGVDGAFGPLTANAVRAFQAANGCDVDGVVGPQTWGALNGQSSSPAQQAQAPAPVAGPHSQLQVGARGAEVIALQQKLAANGYDPGPIDGDFGGMTRAAVVRFQAANGLQVDGVVGPSIRNTLINTGNWKGRTDPQPGDLVLFDWNFDGQADHVGLVKSINANGTLTCIEGNTGGPGGQEGVWETTRTWDFVMGFGNPV